MKSKFNAVKRIAPSIAVIAFLSGCGHDHTKVKEKTTAQLVRTFSDATRAALHDCGPAVMTVASYPDIYFHNPGSTGWHGPYVLGTPRATDYFDSKIVFLVTNETLIIVSSGADSRLNTKDDIKEIVPIK